MMTAKIKVENRDTVGAMQDVLVRLLESNFVEAVLVPRMLPDGDGFVQGLIRDPELLKETHPAAPTVAVQSARILSELTSRPLDKRIAAVLKPCELRAATELVKFLQVDLDNVVTIAADCVGTYDVKEYAETTRSGGQQGIGFRESCRICEDPIPANADLSFGFFGFDTSREILVAVGERFEKELADALSLDTTGVGAGVGEQSQREEAVQGIVNERREERRRVHKALKDRVNGPEQLMKTLSTCIRCHNCMRACPICYCKECVFMSPVFEHRPEQFLSWAERRGGIRMPADTLMFHLTRMSHMATSCVGCGMCESACPSRLPISSLFTLVGGDLQEMFAYVPGRDAEEEPPVSVFKEDELQKESAAE